MLKSPHYTSSVVLSIFSVPSLVLRKLLSSSEHFLPFLALCLHPSGLTLMGNWRFNGQTTNDHRNSSNSTGIFWGTQELFLHLKSTKLASVLLLRVGVSTSAKPKNITKCRWIVTSLRCQRNAQRNLQKEQEVPSCVHDSSLLGLFYKDGKMRLFFSTWEFKLFGENKLESHNIRYLLL